MSMLTAADRAVLLGVFTDAQVDTSLTLYRRNAGTGAFDARHPQGVQVSYASQRQDRSSGMAGVDESIADVTFYREPPFDVAVDDRFVVDGHPGGKVTSVGTDPVIGVIRAEGTFVAGNG